MKKIHVLSSDKPSRLIIYSTLLNEFRLLDSPIEDWKHKRNIYITSDEEIKEGDWIINNEQPTLVTTNFFWDLRGKYHKIILTTDQDLIADGVQAIDDEFLEWFVKNPSFEEISTKSYYKTWEDGVTFDRIEYDIIIPKEEPKQEEQ